MALFKFSAEDIDRHATRMARQHLEAAEREAAEREAAETASEPSPAAQESKPEQWRPNLDVLSDVDKSDPFLRSLALRDQRAAGLPQSGQVRAAGHETETLSSSSTAVAEHSNQPGTETLSPAVYAAVQFLSAALRDGKSHPASALLAKAQTRGITEPTLRRARLAIGATTEKVSKEWLWKLSD